jgi:hypothetical protein
LGKELAFLPKAIILVLSALKQRFPSNRVYFLPIPSFVANSGMLYDPPARERAINPFGLKIWIRHRQPCSAQWPSRPEYILGKINLGVVSAPAMAPYCLLPIRGFRIRRMEASLPWISSARAMADSTDSSGSSPRWATREGSSAPATKTRPACRSRFRG